MHARVAEAKRGSRLAAAGSVRHYDALKRRRAGRALARLELRLEQPPVGLVADPKQRLPGHSGQCSGSALRALPGSQQPPLATLRAPTAARLSAAGTPDSAGVLPGKQGRRDSNPQPPVLETGALPVELRP
jgi:hypothetical protein